MLHRALSIAVTFTVLCAGATMAQHAGHDAPSLATAAGQDAFAAIAEVVRLLEADPSTDWSRVNLERLRLHLADMHYVTIEARVTEEEVPGGIRAEVGGAGRTRDAIRRMASAHSALFDATGELSRYRVAYAETAEGARLTVTARVAADTATVARIRGLGFIGLMTLGSHHQAHHLELARGR